MQDHKLIVIVKRLELQLHDAIYRLRFYLNSFIHILLLSNSHNKVASIQKNRGDKSHRVIVALDDFHAQEECAVARLAINLKVTGDSLLIHEFAYSLFIGSVHRSLFGYL